MNQQFVAYYRVSTARQGQSGLGLEAQQATVAEFVRQRVGTVVEHFVEVESGKKNQRPQLQAAMTAAKRQGAVLLIAKLDRLSRNVGFIFALRDAGVEFVCCDLPDANTLTIGLFAVMAQHERELTAARTRSALAAKKARGERMGTPANLPPNAWQTSKRVRRQDALGNKANVQALQLALLLQGAGISRKQIAVRLNQSHHQTRNGCAWTTTAVSRLLARYEEHKAAQVLATA